MAYKINGTTVVDNSRNVCACCVTSCCITASSRMDAPSGTTAQRPSSPATGSIYFDTDLGSLVSYNGTEWASVGGGGLELDEFSNEYYSTLHMYVNSGLCKGQICGACGEVNTMNANATKYNSLMGVPFSNCQNCYNDSGCAATGPQSCIWWAPAGGSSTLVPGEVTFCYRGGFGGYCAYVSNTVVGSCSNRQLPCWPGFQQNSWHTVCGNQGFFYPIIDGSAYGHTHKRNCQQLALCGAQVYEWTEGFLTPKGGAITKDAKSSYPFSNSCTSICFVDPQDFYAPTYLYPSSCLGPIQATPMSLNAITPASHKYLAYPVMYITCTDSNMFTLEEEMCCYGFLFTNCSATCAPSDHFPYYWGNSYCMCLKCQMPHIELTGLNTVCCPTSGFSSCAFPFFTYRSDLTSKPDHFNKEMYTCTTHTCDGINVKTFDPSCCPALWYHVGNASCRCTSQLCYAGAFNNVFDTVYWDCGGDVAWIFAYKCYAMLCAFATCGQCGYQCVTQCQCCGRYEQNCIGLITKFCRPNLSFQYWSPKQPRCFQPWQCCRGCTHLCHTNWAKPNMFCQMGLMASTGANGANGDACSQTANVTSRASVTYTQVTSMCTPFKQKVVQHPTCSNWLMLFSNGNYNAHNGGYSQRQMQAPTYSLFDKSTCQFRCVINFDAMINYNCCVGHLAKWYTMTPSQLCNCGTNCMKTIACLFLGQNVSNPQLCFAACIQAITGCCAKSIIHHCQGHDYCYVPLCFGSTSGCMHDHNLIGMGSACEQNYYYNPCSNHLVFVGGLSNCGVCGYNNSCKFQWIGAICFDLDNCCITKVNQIFPSTDPCVNCKILDPAASGCRPVMFMCFKCNVGIKCSCNHLKEYGLSIAKYGSDKINTVGGTYFLFGGVHSLGADMGTCGFQGNSCCQVVCGSCYFGCSCTGGCDGIRLTAVCSGCSGNFFPTPNKAKVPYDVPLECVGFKSSEVFKNFWALRWLAGLQYNPWGASTACRYQLTSCLYNDSDASVMPFFSGWCCLCYGGCYTARTGSVGGPTMTCCCMYSVTRTYMENQIVAGQNCIYVCGQGTSLCCRPCDLFKHCCFCKRFTNDNSNLYCKQIVGSVVQLIDNIAPCHFEPDATKRYSKYLRLNTNAVSEDYASTGKLGLKSPFKLDVGEDYMDGAIRIWNEGIACSC